MDAGRELDALVAERVMGYQWWHREGLRNHLLSPDAAQWAGSLDMKPGAAETDKAFYNGAPPYSTDIAAAWEVIERMTAQGWHYEIGGPAASTPHWARFGRGDYDPHNDEWDEQHIGMGSAAPHAICLAALRAIGEEPAP